MRMIRILFLSLLTFSCDNWTEDPDLAPIPEAGFVLPFPVGRAYYCSQGFNSDFSHHGSFRYSVDFIMPVGSVITASRAGQVVHTNASFSDNDHAIGHENVIIIRHADSTFARYVHLTQKGVLVSINEWVQPGDTIGLSGNSGQSRYPHLHFDVTQSFSERSDQTIPFDFLNTEPRPVGLHHGHVFDAMPYRAGACN